MQLSLDEFYNYSPRQFQNYSSGFIESKDQKIKTDLYATRWISYWSAFGFLKKGTQPNQLMGFPWEEDEASETSMIPTEEEVNEVIDFWKKIDKIRANETSS